MRKTTLILIIILILSLSQGCITRRKAMQLYGGKSESVYIEKIREVPVPVPGDSAYIEIPVNCPDQDLVQSEFTRLRQEIYIMHGKLVSKTVVKPETIIVKVPEIKTVEKIVEVQEPVEIEVPVKYIPGIYKYSFWICVTALAAGVYLALKKVFKLSLLNIFKRLING